MIGICKCLIDPSLEHPVRNLSRVTLELVLEFDVVGKHHVVIVTAMKSLTTCLVVLRRLALTKLALLGVSIHVDGGGADQFALEMCR